MFKVCWVFSICPLKIHYPACTPLVDSRNWYLGPSLQLPSLGKVLPSFPVSPAEMNHLPTKHHVPELFTLNWELITELSKWTSKKNSIIRWCLPRKAGEDGPAGWAPAPMWERPRRNSGSWLWPGSVLALAATWGENIPSPLSLSHFLSPLSSLFFPPSVLLFFLHSLSLSACMCVFAYM